MNPMENPVEAFCWFFGISMFLFLLFMAVGTRKTEEE